MYFIIPGTTNRVLFINLHVGKTVSIFQLSKNFNQLPKEIIDSRDFYDYLDNTKVMLSIELKQYLNYENIPDHELNEYNLTKDFIKYTIDEATKEAEKMNERMKKENNEFETRIYQNRLKEIVFKLCKEYGDSIYEEIEEHNIECQKRGFKTYTLDDYKDLLEKYKFTRG
jgi:hypothetical protein